MLIVIPRAKTDVKTPKYIVKEITKELNVYYKIFI